MSPDFIIIRVVKARDNYDTNLSVLRGKVEVGTGFSVDCDDVTAGTGAGLRGWGGMELSSS